ncbi:multiple sugar transport system permease protein [Kribbella aluminosa]|uniref:Multiple sugar transport system permease protein n=1 Tax=Kribbella aluminosa TaxID=416017 RepID=A0ABS4UX16_9ACTN|nr:sugar ABC transporter permease [Kribbella aluminosa]MBP2356189.1 multiple sugar transport system permease protein [Kribbella aluminosa]
MSDRVQLTIPGGRSAVSRPSVPRRARRQVFPVLLVLPAVTLLTAVLIYPLIGAVIDAFFDHNLLVSGRTFTGLDNLASAAKDLWPLLRTTLLFAVPATLLPFLIGLVAALGLNQRMRGRGILRSVLLVPWILPGVVVSFLWLWIFDANYGVLNGVLRSIGLIDSNVGWLDSGTGALLAVVVARCWSTFPWMMVMLLAGLQALPAGAIEAAHVDGANALQRFRFITWPSLRPVAGVVVLLEFMWNFQHFDTIYVLTGGGPARATTTFSLAVYETAFKGFDLGKASAIGLLWLAFLLPIVLIYLRITENKS